jgi:hypothetical protein
MEILNKIFVPVCVDLRLPKSFATIHIVLLDGRLPMITQWRPSTNGGEWWTLGMANATRMDEKKKCVTHWLEEKQKRYVLSEEEYMAMKEKSEKWDALEEKIASCYVDKNGNELEDENIDLGTIGEIAASAFEWL